MPTSFAKEDVNSCFALDCKRRPEFRLIYLDGEGTDVEGNHVERGVRVALFCRECAAAIVSDLTEEIEGTVEADIPVLGVMLLPISMTTEDVEQLREEITPEVWLDPEEQQKAI